MKDRLFLRLLSVTVMLGLLISLIGCGGRGATATDSAAAQGASPESYEASLSETGGDPAEGLSGGRKLITTADLSLDVTDFASAVDEIESQTAALGGYFSSVSRGGSAEQGNRWAEYHARIPAARLDEFLDSADGIGTVTSLTQGTEDITPQYVDNEARLESLRTQEQRLLELLEQAGSLEDLILLEDKLTEVRYEIEALTGQQRIYDNQVEYATVHLWVNEVSRQTITAPTFGDRVVEAFYGSLQNVADLAQGAVILAIYFAPFLLFFALLVGLLFLLLRRRHRTKRTTFAQQDSLPQSQSSTPKDS